MRLNDEALKALFLSGALLGLEMRENFFKCPPSAAEQFVLEHRNLRHYARDMPRY